MSIWKGSARAFLTALICACGLAFGYYITATITHDLVSAPYGEPPTCYTFHRAVVIVPAVCAKHDICETPIEAKVCDSILIRGAKR